MPFDQNEEAANPAPSPEPEWLKLLAAADDEGAFVVQRALGVLPQTGVVYWVSACRGIELGRDPIEGSVLLRLAGTAMLLSATELAVLTGMLRQAASLQGAMEANKEGDQS